MDQDASAIVKTPLRSKGYDGPPMRISGDLAVKEPDELMSDIRKSIMAKTLIVAIIAHTIVVGLTSFGLYAKWSRYGIAMPNTINKIIENEKREAEQERVRAERAQREERQRQEAAERLEQNPPPPQNQAPDPRQAAVDKLENEKLDDRPGSSTLDLDF